MKKGINIYLGFLAAIIIIFTFAFKNGKEGDASAQIPSPRNNEKGLPQVVKPVTLKKYYDFAGEALPMDNFDVRERLDRELTVNSYYHSSTTQNLKNAVRYFPVIEEILKKHNLPEDLKYLSVAESNLSNATSPAGAKGFWQFMRPAAQQYKLTVNSEVDERFHIEKATEAACQYFKYLHKRFGNWTLAAAAYNMGPTRLSKELALQKMDSYYDMNLNTETSRYLFRIVAIKEVMRNPNDFGFYVDDSQAYPPLTNYKTVEVNAAIPNLGDFAKDHGTTYRMIKLYNPWLIASRLTNSARRTYEIKVPR